MKEDALLLPSQDEIGTALRGLLPDILNLPVWDKFKLISVLADDLGRPKNEAETIIPTNQLYYVYTPEFEPGAAEQLMQLLEKTEKGNYDAL